MTVVLGTICEDGLVIAADREVSGDGGVKFYEKKIFTFPTVNADIVLGYSGIPDVMRGLERDLRSRLEGQTKSSADIERDLRQALEKVIAKNDKSQFWTLCGFCEGGTYRLLKTYQRDVFPVPVWDCIGLADNSSLIRYLAAIFLEPSVHLPLFRAVPICNYMVAQAKKYVGGCGGLTDLSIVRPNGKAQEQFSSVFTDNVCDMVEITINAILTTTTEPDITPERLETLIQTLRDVLGNSLKAFPALLQ